MRVRKFYKNFLVKKCKKINNLEKCIVQVVKINDIESYHEYYIFLEPVEIIIECDNMHNNEFKIFIVKLKIDAHTKIKLYEPFENELNKSLVIKNKLYHYENSNSKYYIKYPKGTKLDKTIEHYIRKDI